jgi:hypothetical protein
MATQVPTMAVCFVDATNNVLEDQGEAGSVIRRPSMTVHVVDSTGYIIEDDFAAGSVLGAQPSFAVVVVDSENHVIESDGDAGSVTRQMTTAFRQVGSGSPSMACVRIVDSSNTVLDELFGGGFGIRLSGDHTIAEDASITDIIGTLSVFNGSGDYSFGIDTGGDPDGKFSLVPGEAFLRVGAGLDYEADTSHPVTIVADNGVDDPITRTFTITVTNVLEVTLNALTLDTDEIEGGYPEDTPVGSLQGVTSGSTLELTDDAGGRFKLDGEDIVAGETATDYDSATSHNITVRETHADGSNSPRDSVIAITVNPESIAPILSGTDVDEVTETTATAQVTTDEANGTLYMVVTDNATDPSAAQVKAGQDHAGAAADFADDVAVDSTGAKSFNVTGLSSATNYYAYFMHEDAVGNQSSVANFGPFLTSSVADVPGAFTIAWASDTDDNTPDLDIQWTTYGDARDIDANDVLRFYAAEIPGGLSLVEYATSDALTQNMIDGIDPITFASTTPIVNGTHQVHARASRGGSLGDLSNEIIVVVDATSALGDLLSTMNVSSPWRGIQQLPTGTVDATARKTLLGLYGGI